MRLFRMLALVVPLGCTTFFGCSTATQTSAPARAAPGDRDDDREDATPEPLSPSSEAELAAGEILDHLEEGLDATWKPEDDERRRDASWALARAVELFQVRHGARLTETKRWPEIEKAARDLAVRLGVLRGQGSPLLDGWAWRDGYCTVLALAGRADDAMELLDQDEGPTAGCGSFRASFTYAIAARESAIHEWKGDDAAALVAIEDALEQASYALGGSVPGEALLHARHGAILLRLERARGGRQALLRVVDLYHEDDEARALARQLLEATGGVREPTIDDLVRDYGRECPRVDAAIARQELPGAFEHLRDRLASGPRLTWSVTRALATLDDRRAIEPLRAFLRSSPRHAARTHALVALVDLGDAAVALPIYLDTIEEDTDGAAGYFSRRELEWSHEVLTRAYGGGPSTASTDRARFVEEWRRWLRRASAPATGGPSGAASSPRRSR